MPLSREKLKFLLKLRLGRIGINSGNPYLTNVRSFLLAKKIRIYTRMRHSGLVPLTCYVAGVGLEFNLDE